MGVGSSSSKQLAASFGDDEQTGKRGPTLGSILLEGPEAGAWRLLLVSPLRVQVFNAHDAKIVELEEATLAALKIRTPFTAFCASQAVSQDLEASHGTEDTRQPPSQQIAIGCQDGTVLVFNLSSGSVCAPIHELKFEEENFSQTEVNADLSKSITAVHLHGQSQLFTGACGRCFSWDLQSGDLQREFHLPGGPDHPATPSSLVAVPQDAGLQLWVGLDTGSLAVFEVQSGMLMRSFSCCGPEVVVCLAFCHRNSVVFALSAHKRVTIWDASSFSCLQKYPAELMTCGSDLSAMAAIDLRSAELSLLVLAGVDGSLCIRRITRRADRKLNCVLLWYLETAGGDMGCPLTALSYHPATDSVVLGDAGCHVALLQKLREQLGTAVEMVEPAPRGAAAQVRAQVAPPGATGTAEEPGQRPMPAPAKQPPREAPDNEAALVADLPPEDDADPAHDGYPAAAGPELARDGYPGASSDTAAFPVFSG